MKTAFKIFLGMGIMLVIIGLYNWSVKHDAEISTASSIYEKCVQANFRTTPSAYYAQNGEYPECE